MFERLVKAVKKVGFLQPIVVRPVDDNYYEIVDGVHRARAAGMAGMTKVPCVVIDDCTADSAIAVQIGMNRMRGELDLSRVADGLVELLAAGWPVGDLLVTGFGEAEIADLLAATKAEEVEIPPEASDDSPEKPDKEWILEVSFMTRKGMMAAKKELKKQAGKEELLGEVLLRVLAEDGGNP
jgi:ParB-like chromosome segregation protein Spo0J